jgi:Limiting CO2-inducible proteins B/C beta carbonyic anhydrases
MFLRTHTLGGLSGVPFDGTKAFIEILSGIPSGGSCFLLYGPHVNVNAQAFENSLGDGCAFKRYGGCVGAINAVAFVWEKSDGNDTRTPSVVSDSEQFFLNQMLLAYSQDFQMPSESSIELPLVLFDFQTSLINRFIAKGCRHIRADQLIVVVGGIQFNTPHGYSDCFLPLRIEVVNHHGTSKLSEELRLAKSGQ